MDLITLYNGSFGLNTVVEPSRIPFDPETGITGLQEAVNVVVESSPSRAICRRDGYDKVLDGEFHSLFTASDMKGGQNNYCLCIQERDTDAAIMRIGTDFSLSGIRSGLTKNREMYFCRVGDGRIFYSNGRENGYIKDGLVSNPWPSPDYIGPETSRHFQPAPLGKHIAFSSGRLFIAVANAVFWSEPYKYDLFDLTRNFWSFGSDVLMIAPVLSGIFVSDREGIYFFQGNNPAEAKMIQVDNVPAIEGSMCQDLVDGTIINPDFIGWFRMWVSSKGLRLGTPDGNIIHINEREVIYPDNYSKGACVLSGDYAIHTLFL